MRRITQENGVPLIFDEVVTGFRLAYGGAQEYYGVVPDLCTLGKVIGGGFPLAAIAGKAVWGTDWPSPGIKSMRTNADAFLALPLSDGAKRGILHDNSAKLWR